MNVNDVKRAQRLDVSLRAYEVARRKLVGIQNAVNRATFVGQLVESIRRIEYVLLISTRPPSRLRTDPLSDQFDPLKAAIWHRQQGDIDEAFWLVFLSVHFGRHGRDGWRLCRDAYAGPRLSPTWTWSYTTSNLSSVRTWLASQTAAWKTDGVPRRFGNHRKYQSLDAWAKNGTGAALESYVEWVGRHKNHQGLIEDAQSQVGTAPREMFDCLYNSMNAVASFGRTAKFDYLTMVGKLGLASIEPGSTYMNGATGPLSGAKLLFVGDTKARISPSVLEEWLVQLGAGLGVGMQVLEDALCNWQKSPVQFKRFRG